MTQNINILVKLKEAHKVLNNPVMRGGLTVVAKVLNGRTKKSIKKADKNK